MNKLSQLSIFLLISIFSTAFTTDLVAQEKTRYANFEEALYAGGQLSGSNGPGNVVWINDGQQYSYTQRNPENNASEIRSYDPASGEDQIIFVNTDFNTPGTDDTFEYNSFQWTDDSRFIVFQSNFRPIYRRSGISDYYYYEVETGELNILVKDAMTAELSPDGSKVGFEREGDLFVYDLDVEKETRLTNSGAENFYNGRFGWVYEEEFGLAQAWSWSHNSKYIAYWQTDERDVKLFVSTDYSGNYPEYVKIPYPKVGEENPKIKIGTVNVESGENTWMDLDLNDGYVPRLYWTSEAGNLAIVWMNRPQNQLQLHFFDADSGEANSSWKRKMKMAGLTSLISLQEFSTTFSSLKTWRNFCGFPNEMDSTISTDIIIPAM